MNDFKYIGLAERQKNTDNFITKYCQHYSTQNPRPVVTNKEVIERRWQDLLLIYETVFKDKVKIYLNKRQYKKVFLTSFWWYVIRNKVLMRDGWSCQGTNCTTPDCKDLHVHHKTYDHKGEEVAFIEDLITLCDGCHKAEHPELLDKPVKKKRKKRKRIFRKRRDVLELEAEAVMNSFEDKVENLRKADAENKARLAEKVWTKPLVLKVTDYNDFSAVDCFADVVDMLNEVIEILNN